MADMGPIVAIVVVYNVSCADSLTCQALAQMHDADVSVLIYDNSTADYGNGQYCQTQGWGYLGGEGNKGLSKAYNACIDYIKMQMQEGFVCLFDDDTKINANYFTMLRTAMVDSQEKIFVPLIYSGVSLVSPCILRPGHRIVKFESEEKALSYMGGELSAINSGMALDLSLFDEYRYDENIFLDGIDHHFLADMKAKGEPIKVFPYKCNHAFSGDEKPSKDSALIRFSILEKDFRYILRKDKATYFALIGKRALKLTLQYKTLDFLYTMLRKKPSSSKEAL